MRNSWGVKGGRVGTGSGSGAVASGADTEPGSLYGLSSDWGGLAVLVTFAGAAGAAGPDVMSSSIFIRRLNTPNI